MIVVDNTKELEEKYDLNILPDDMKVIVLGGLKNKSKYNAIRYQNRVTYTGRQIKLIIAQMKLIENEIPEQWNEFQRAKYIYEVLGRNISYNHNREEYKTQQSSNLSILLSRKGICAGYSLLYKEMMDRQGIECDYVRGIAKTGEKVERHAWNVLTINGTTSIPVDLTWDSERMRNGEDQLCYFGVNREFTKNHEIDSDEKEYPYVVYSKDFVNSINTNPKENLSKINEEQKMRIIQLAIEETYKKYNLQGNSYIAKEQVKKAIELYITSKEAIGFTRNGNARTQLKQYVSSEDMLNLLAKSYTEQNLNDYNSTILGGSVRQNAIAYGTEHATKSLVQYITTGKADSFTRTNNARKNIIEFVTTDDAMSIMIDETLNKEIERISKSNIICNDIINREQKEYFSGDEFAQAQLPQEKRTGIIKKAIQWIKEKMKERQKINNIKNDNINKENENQR